MTCTTASSALRLSQKFTSTAAEGQSCDVAHLQFACGLSQLLDATTYAEICSDLSIDSCVVIVVSL